jgi:predicted ATP-grasp superfamily ATP-dependent carboligase
MSNSYAGLQAESQVYGPLFMIGFTCRALAQCARRDGFLPTVIDRCGDRDTREAANRYRDWLPDPQQSIEAMDEYLAAFGSPSGASKSLPLFCILAGGTENNIALIEGLSRRFSNLMKPESFIAMRSWRNWKSWAESSGLFSPRTCELSTFRPEVARMNSTQGLLVKDLNQAGGLGISTWESEQEPKDLGFDSKIDHRVVQERIDGEAIGVTFLSSSHGSIALGCTEAWPPQTHPWGSYIYHGSIGPVSLSRVEWAALDGFAERVACHANWLGLWQADFIRKNDRWYLLEINPRWTASMELLDASIGLRIVQLHCLASSGLMRKETWTSLCLRASQWRESAPSLCLAKRVLYAGDSTAIDDATLRRWWDNRLPLEILRGEGDTPSGCWIADIPNEPMQFENGFPVCTLIGLHRTAHEARKTVEEQHRYETQHLKTLQP